MSGRTSDLKGFDSRLGKIGVHGNKALAEWVYADQAFDAVER